jgi:predicted nucleotide-binding protein
MLKALEGLDSQQVQRTLSLLTRALLPSPSKENMFERLEALPTVHRLVLREVCEQLGLPGIVPTADEVPLVLDFLNQELSAAALSKADIEDLQARTFEEESKAPKPRERTRPRVFISSSVEGIEYARAIQIYLERYAISQIWDEQRFDLGRPVLESLIRTVSRFDFAVLVFTADDYLDIAKSRGFARSNVAFEAGLFVGRLGIRRTFFVAPQDASMHRFASDLAGVSIVNYDSQAPSSAAAVGPAAYQILNQIRTLGSVGSRELKESSS